MIRARAAITMIAHSVTQIANGTRRFRCMFGTPGAPKNNARSTPRLVSTGHPTEGVGRLAGTRHPDRVIRLTNPIREGPTSPLHHRGWLAVSCTATQWLGRTARGPRKSPAGAGLSSATATVCPRPWCGRVRRIVHMWITGTASVGRRVLEHSIEAQYAHQRIMCSNPEVVVSRICFGGVWETLIISMVADYDNSQERFYGYANEGQATHCPKVAEPEAHRPSMARLSGGDITLPRRQRWHCLRPRRSHRHRPARSEAKVEQMQEA